MNTQHEAWQTCWRYSAELLADLQLLLLKIDVVVVTNTATV